MPSDDLTRFQYDLLVAIDRLERREDRPPKGLDVMALLEDEYGTDLNHGRLYPNLDDLESKGLISKGRRDDRTNAYSTTRRGRRELEDLREWVRASAVTVRDR